jgi:transcription-repair coupling factor (superfamily II helicase)
MHMSLIGLRDMDLIEEPPEDRYPVQTYVMEENEEIIRETIRRELDRQGQVYAVVSRISSVDRVAADIQRLVPEASVAAGHGRMNETQLENVMIDFIDRKYDVLVSTTIIESGIDIPNVNTIIIFDADRFGLSQLYQLRGRVGRTNRIAFAYLLYRKDKVVSEVAEKRLRTIREFTEFGAGFKIAMRDLEIRGAGNILGSEQHGHMVAVGYELYCKMVDDAVKALSGTEPVDAAVDVTIDLPLSAYIPESYISDESLKLQAYKKIALVESRTEKNDVAGELEDRFGQLPPQVASLIRISYARFLAGKAGIRKISTADDTGGIVLFYISGEKLRPKGIAAAYAVFGERISISGTRAPSVRITAGKLTGSPADALATLDDLILLLETLLIVA